MSIRPLVRRARTSEPGRRRRRPVAALLGGLTIAVLAAGCVFPAEPPYPYFGPYGSRQGVINEAQRQSDVLTQYVKDVLDGKKPADIPTSILPSGYPKKLASFKVLRENEIDANKQWVVRDARPIDRNNSPGLYPDVAATYYVMPHFWVPFGSKAVVTGAFPKARFFSIQASGSFMPETYGGRFGVGEVPIVDADINPDAGHVNPYRVGANRNATNRNYTVTFESKIGNPVNLTDAYKPSTFFRAAGNTRPTSGLRFAGPWGDPSYSESSPLRSLGPDNLWTFGELWVRTYVADNGTGPRGGVGLPKVTYQLPDGRKFFIQADLGPISLDYNKAEPIQQEAPADPNTAKCGPTVGWQKNWGILRNGLQVANETYGSGPNPAYVRNVEKGVAGRAEDLPAPQNYESTESLVPYQSYLGRCMSIGTGKVAILTGRKPTTPKTRNGQATMAAAQARFFSITTYDDSLDLLNTSRPIGQPISYVNDEDIVTDANGYYTIVYSKLEDKPSNCTAANGCTWVDWGPKGNSGFFLRWMSVGPEWRFAKTPDQLNLGRKTDYSSVQYDANIIGRNNRTGFLGEYQPIVSYMTKTQFQNLGTNIRWNQIPTWN